MLRKRGNVLTTRLIELFIVTCLSSFQSSYLEVNRLSRSYAWGWRKWVGGVGKLFVLLSKRGKEDKDTSQCGKLATLSGFSRVLSNGHQGAPKQRRLFQRAS